jgi:hypothetical protein
LVGCISNFVCVDNFVLSVSFAVSLLADKLPRQCCHIYGVITEFTTVYRKGGVVAVWKYFILVDKKCGFNYLCNLYVNYSEVQIQ